MTGGCESRPTRVVADRSEPSLAGVVVTRGPKRRQGSCGVRKDSPERLNVVEAETVPVVEGHVYAVVMQDGDAPPGRPPIAQHRFQTVNRQEIGFLTKDTAPDARSRPPTRRPRFWLPSPSR